VCVVRSRFSSLKEGWEGKREKKKKREGEK